MLKFIVIILLSVSILFGQNTHSLSFDGGDWLQHIGAYRTNDNVGAISCWFKTTDASGLQIIFASNDTTTTIRYFIFRIQDSEIRILAANSSINSILTTGVISGIDDGTWHHAVATSNGSTTKVYYDGVEKSLTVVSGSNTGMWLNDTDARNNTTIGGIIRSNAPTWYFKGYLDEISYFSSYLTADNVAELYNNGKPKDLSGVSGLEDWWRFEEGSGLTTYNEDNDFNFRFGNGATTTTYPTWSTETPGCDSGKKTGFSKFGTFKGF